MKEDICITIVLIASLRLPRIFCAHHFSFTAFPERPSSMRFVLLILIRTFCMIAHRTAATEFGTQIVTLHNIQHENIRLPWRVVTLFTISTSVQDSLRHLDKRHVCLFNLIFRIVMQDWNGLCATFCSATSHSPLTILIVPSAFGRCPSCWVFFAFFVLLFLFISQEHGAKFLPRVEVTCDG